MNTRRAGAATTPYPFTMRGRGAALTVPSRGGTASCETHTLGGAVCRCSSPEQILKPRMTAVQMRSKCGSSLANPTSSGPDVGPHGSFGPKPLRWGRPTRANHGESNDTRLMRGLSANGHSFEILNYPTVRIADRLRALSATWGRKPGRLRLEVVCLKQN